MLRTTASKVAWVGRTASMVFGLALVLALVLGVATMALAAVPGDPFKLGQVNTINAITQLVGSRDGSLLRVDNNSSGAGAHALNLEVNADKFPLKVNATAGKATNLNADKVDGQSFTCPGGTLFHEGVCIETTMRAFATFSTAQDDCLGEGRRLPSPEELQTFRKRSGHDFKGNVEYTSEINFSSSTASPIVVNANLGHRFATNQESVWDYRCAVPPS
jgi:FlaG/FlaF family flagellin (archaellin)